MAVGDEPKLPERVSAQQASWYKKYKKQANAPKPDAMKLNTDSEPDLKTGFVSLVEPNSLKGWTAKGGTCEFEVTDGVITGTCVPGSPSTYLSTERDDFTDFVFSCDVKWLVDGNSGVMFRAQEKSSGKGVTVFGPQAEMEGIANDRGWSGGIYGQSCGGYFYPLWLKEHEEIRKSIQADGWNRITISARGNTVKTWVNGIPAAHWEDDGTYSKGFFGLQIHKGQKGKVLFRNVRVKELGS
ncbi:MAG: DUF1080 domain-containing protein [Planctomycetota bacterium]